MRKIQNIVDERQQVLAGTVDFFEVGAEFTHQLPLHDFFLQHLGLAQNGVKRRPQLVAHVGQKPTFGLIGRFGGLLSIIQFLLRPLSLSDVANHLGRAYHMPGGILDRRYRDGAVELPPVTGVVSVPIQPRLDRSSAEKDINDDHILN